MHVYDALIVGAGPAGSLAAYLLGKNRDVAISEEHQTAGFPVQCAGLISDMCFNRYRRYCKIEKALENRIEGAFFFSPSGNYIEAKGEAYVIERKILDKLLFEKASEVADVFVKTKVKFEESKAVLGCREIRSKSVIGADGVNSTVARCFGFERPKLFTAVQAEVRFDAIDENFVELYFGKKWSGSFFAYAIPIGDTARVGAISREGAMEYLKNLIERHPSVSKRIRGGVIELNVGAIPDRLVDFAKDNVALIGDSAGMVKPYTGGGLYYLLLAAEKLAENFPDFKGYKRAYLKELGREYEFGYKIRRLYSLDDRKMEKLFEIMKGFDFPGVHMDRPSTLQLPKSAFKIAFRLIKNPELAFSILKLLI